MKQKTLSRLDRTMMAITFAEAGEDRQAVKYLTSGIETNRKQKSERPGTKARKEDMARTQMRL
ncbi:MAG: hypothetical protein R6V41_02170 [Desulfobacteraceae bacterium]